MRSFEPVKDEFKKYNKNKVKMPVRATKHSVGYDFYSPIDIVINPASAELIWTNVKSKFNTDEGLLLSVTSGMGKNNIILANGIGIIESDYFENASNDGNLGFRLYNYGSEPYAIKAGDKIGQGVFFKYLKVDNEEEVETVRTGGFGSTNK